MTHRLVNARINSYANASTSYKRLVKMGPVGLELNWDSKYKLYRDSTAVWSLWRSEMDWNIAISISVR